MGERKIEIENGEINYDSEGYIKGFYLNHSCDEWVIGSLEDAEEFNRNLTEAIEFAKEILEKKV